MDNDKSKISQTIGREVGHISRAHRVFMSEALSGTGLRGPEPQLLLFLEHFEGSSQDFLASLLAMDKSGVARAASFLEEQGLIRREQNPDNRRKNKMYITESGRALIPVIREKLSAWEELLLDGFTEEERKTILLFIDKMSRNCDKLQKNDEV